VTTLLTTLATKLAEKWMTLVVLPGLLLLATAFAGTMLKHRHALDVRHLVGEVNRFGKAAGGTPAATLAVMLVALLLASAAAGLLAQAAGAGLRWLWTVTPRHPDRLPLVLLTRRRRDRWTKLDRDYRAAQDDVDQATAAVDDARAVRSDSVEVEERRLAHAVDVAAAIAARRNRIACARPSRPTWMGDRLAAAETRVRGQYGLDLSAVWPRLQLVVPDAARADLRSAADAWNRAGIVAGWGLLYLPVTVVWWPAAPIGLAVLLVGRRRGRAAAAALADLAESAVDLYAPTLAEQLGVTAPVGAVNPALGRRITEQLRKGT
jgi:hypothetical protein